MTDVVIDRDRLVEMVAAGTPPDERVFGDGHFLRPNFIQPYQCTNVLVEGVTLLRSPMWEVHPVLCTNVTVRKLIVKTLGPNNDGCNPECCRDVLIEDCLFETGDDCIAIKSGRNDDGRRIGVPSENIVIRCCSFKDGHGGVTLGSEIAGGSIRIHDQALQRLIFKLLQISDEEAKLRFGFFTEALEYGTPPHGGIALGLDRIVAILAGEASIRDVIAFPKTAQAVDLMAGAPSSVADKQLQELKLRSVTIEQRS